MFVATGRSLAPAQLLAAVAEHLLPEWTARVTAHPFGSLLVAGDEATRDERWLVVGRPTKDPWGTPGEPLGRDEVLADLVRFGPNAISAVAGPVLAFDLDDGRAHRTLGGVLGFGPHPGDLRVHSTIGSAEAPPGTTIVPDSSPAFSIDRLCDEIAHHVGGTGVPLPLRTTTSHPWPCAEAAPLLDRVHALGRDAAVLVIDAELLANPALFARVRDRALPELHYRCLQAGRWLHAPGFERPVLDQLGFGQPVAV